MLAPRDRGAARRTLAAALVVAVLLVAGCGVGRADPGTDDATGDPAVTDGLAARRELYVAVTWDDIDRRLDELVARRGLEGAAVIVESAGGERRLHQAGEVDLAAPVPLAETSMWLTTAVLLTLVDDGALSLDDPVGEKLPGLTGPASAITLRQLLSHTSGLPTSLDCAEPTAASCDDALSGVALVDEPGESFAVTSLDQHLAARLAEEVSGVPWSDLAQERLLVPLGLSSTAFADPEATGGLLAVDGTTTPDDLGRFLAMVRDGGRSGDTVVLSPGSVREMLLDQTVRLDTHTEPWVAETGVPTYGLGVWRDRLRGAEEASVVSAPSRWGLYPFVDDARDVWGLVLVDDRTAPRAQVVSESAVLSQLTVALVRRAPEG